MSKPKLIEQIENAGGVFIATINTTTYQEIKEAYDSGKDIITTANDVIYELTTIPEGDNSLTFQGRNFSNFGYASTYYTYITLSTDGTWKGPYYIGTENTASRIKYDYSTVLSSSDGFYRPIRISTSEPTASDGNTGDIWIQYEAD